MCLRGAALAVLVASSLLGACGERKSAAPPPGPAPATATAPAPAPAPPAPNITVKARIQPGQPELTFKLIADAAPEPGGVLQVRAIEIRREGETEPMQRIDGLATQTPWSPDAPGLEALDMNFDGYADIRLIESRPAGPNVPYLNWLFDPASGRFVASPALNDITAPQFDAAKKEIASTWRDGPADYGTDVYTWRDGQPVLTRKETRKYTRPGQYTLEVQKQVNGAWRVVEKRQGRDP